MSHAQNRNKVLVIGREGTGKHDLVKAILKQTKSPESEKDIVSCLLRNKYYTAFIEFVIDDTEPDLSSEVIEAFDELGEVFDGVIFVGDKNKKETFEDLKPWLAFTTKFEPGVCLCIGNNILNSSEGDSKVDTEEIDDWCLEHGFEYIDMDEEAENETTGVHRIVEALESHRWDGMIMNGESPDPIDDSPEEPRDEKWMRNMLESHQESVKAEDLPDMDEVHELHEQLFGNINLDSEDNGLDRAFELILSLKEQSKNMSESERRKLATKVALSFGLQLEKE
ncbi:hypothetical protein K493DRAFT_319762 [Basidiobolus meristosporus CBS 931.73]|uniref:Increased recombination centers protein 6 n=1 Tax=Basidiobolus meristosporus CBS 931.73 TaxID=1314790 RepID=A0A1Y1XLQ5_9FUNG|nr:hypothetical protein K493DRAFT_319762 [Basidiobolus meristosporus CBS 931.73]|eukprot:ORX86633.1 hypothetical protein K493DRAFT_319762 [Basidiobolus meristosporus CBS 931.73]